MNKSYLRNLLLRFESQTPLSESENAELTRELEIRHDLVGEILDRQAIDGMLQLMAVVDAEDDFVERCVARLLGQTNSTIKNPFDGETTSSSQDFALETISQLAKKSFLPRKRGREQIAVYQWLAVAASIVLLLSAGWGYSWLHRNSDGQQKLATRATTPDPSPRPTVDTAPASVPDEVLSKSSKTDTHPVASIPQPVESEATEVALENQSDVLVDGGKPPMVAIAESKDKRPSDFEFDLDPTLTKTQESDSQTLAIIAENRKAIWVDEDPENELGVGEHRLLSGSLSLKLKNGVLLQMFGPTEFHLYNADEVRLESGNFMAEIPRTASQFVITTPVGTLRNPINARVQLIVDPVLGVEALVTRGQITLAHSNAELPQECVELAKNRMYQSVVRPLLDRPSISPLMMARGKDEFTGQIGRGRNTLKMDSPAIFATVLNRLSDQTEPSAVDEEFANDWLKFAQEFQAVAGDFNSPKFQELMHDFLGDKSFVDPAKKMGDVLGNGTTNFQGSLSINGVEHKFNSREEYEQARLRMQKEWPQGISFNSEQENSASDFKGVISVNGRTLEFSSPDKFKALRKQMTR